MQLQRTHTFEGIYRDFQAQSQLNEALVPGQPNSEVYSYFLQRRKVSSLDAYGSFMTADSPIPVSVCRTRLERLDWNSDVPIFELPLRSLGRLRSL